MARATTKIELMDMANQQFEKLLNLISQFDEKQAEADFCFDAVAMTQKDGAAHWQRDKNLRDVLVHLHEWHKLLVEWEKSNSTGISKPFLPPPYTWKSYGEMNVEFWKKHQDTSLEKARQLLLDSHQQVLSMIEKYSDQQLFTKQFFNWTGTSSLGQYCISATASHYDWAMKKLKVQLKALQK